MAITDVQVNTMLAEVKKSLAIFYDSEDTTLRRLIISVIDIMRKSGINDDQIISDAGIAQVVILTSDMWRAGGEYNVSNAYWWLNSLNYSASRADDPDAKLFVKQQEEYIALLTEQERAELERLRILQRDLEIAERGNG